MSRKIQGKSMGRSQNLNENAKKKQSSLYDPDGDKLGKGMLSLNPAIEKNSLAVQSIEIIDIVERREKHK